MRSAPRAWLRKLWRSLRGSPSPARAGLSVGIGLFIGCLPLYGLHLPLCLALCLPFGLDSVLAYLAANISNPLLAPLLIFIEVELGSWLLSGHWVAFNLETARRTGAAGFALQVLLGGLVLGAALGLVGGVCAAAVARRSTSELARAARRTRRRYRAAPVADRWYVRCKLWLDPVAAQLANEGELGDVLDVGCGRGQLGLFVHDLGRTRSLAGFDFDARKIEVAERAAAGDAVYSVGDATVAGAASADTVLLIDVLHYLTAEQQDHLLASALAALRPGGRLMVREADASAGARAALTRALERAATALGYNRARAELGFRSAAELRARLERLGCRVRITPPAAHAVLANFFLVATHTGASSSSAEARSIAPSESA